jgi:hypothetical protein
VPLNEISRTERNMWYGGFHQATSPPREDLRALA